MRCVLLAAAALSGCAGINPGALLDFTESAPFTETPVLARPGYLRVEAMALSDAALPVVAWLDANGVVRWRGEMQRGENDCAFAEVPVFEPTTETNTIQINGGEGRNFRVSADALLHPSPVLLQLAAETLPEKLLPYVTSGLAVPGRPPAADDASERVFTPTDALIFNGRSVVPTDDAMLDVFLHGLAALRGELRERNSDAAVRMEDSALKQKVRTALAREADVWPHEERRAGVVITDRPVEPVGAEDADTHHGRRLTIYIEGENDIPLLIKRLREMFLPPIQVTDMQGAPVHAVVHAFRAGSGWLALLAPPEERPAVIVLKSPQPVSWCDVKRGVLLGRGTETRLPGLLKPPYVVSMLPYSVIRLDVKLERRIHGGAFLRVAVVADKPVTARHAVAAHAEDVDGRVLGGSMRVFRLKRGALKRWYQWGEDGGKEASVLVFRDVISGCRTEVSVR